MKEYKWAGGLLNGFAVWVHPLVSWNLGSVTTSRHWVGFILILPLVQTIRNHHRYRSWHRVVSSAVLLVDSQLILTMTSSPWQKASPYQVQSRLSVLRWSSLKLASDTSRVLFTRSRPASHTRT